MTKKLCRFCLKENGLELVPIKGCYRFKKSICEKHYRAEMEKLHLTPEEINASVREMEILLFKGFAKDLTEIFEKL
jgi:superfamily II helicase